MLAHLHGWLEHARAIDISVPMNLTELKKLSAFKSRNHSQHSCLIAVSQMVLETNDTKRISHQILLAKLNRGVRLLVRARIDKPNRLHWTITQRIDAAPR